MNAHLFQPPDGLDQGWPAGKPPVRSDYVGWQWEAAFDLLDCSFFKWVSTVDSSRWVIGIQRTIDECVWLSFADLSQLLRSQNPEMAKTLRFSAAGMHDRLNDWEDIIYTVYIHHTRNVTAIFWHLQKSNRFFTSFVKKCIQVRLCQLLIFLHIYHIFIGSLKSVYYLFKRGFIQLNLNKFACLMKIFLRKTILKIHCKCK